MRHTLSFLMSGPISPVSIASCQLKAVDPFSLTALERIIHSEAHPAS